MENALFSWDTFTDFGIAGLILGVFFLILMRILSQNASTVKGIVDRMSSDHKESNEAWRATFIEHSNRADSRTQETNKVLRDLTQVMSEANARNQYFQEGRRNVSN